MLLKIFWSAVFLCLPVFGQILAHNSGININDPKYAAQERRAYFNQQLVKAKKVVDLTKDSEAKMLYSFLAEEAIILAPVMYNGGVQGLVCEPPRTGNYVSVFVIFKKDLNLDESFRTKMTKESVAASYDPGTKTLIIKEWANFSDLWAGLILLHEARHAYENIFFPYDWRDNFLFCEHERTTHEFENRLIAKIGGAAYEKILSGEIARIERSLDSAKVDWKKEMVSMRKITGLEKIFGKSISSYETDARNTHVWIDAYFHFYDHKSSSPEEAIDCQDKLLLTLYRQAKILH